MFHQGPWPQRSRWTGRRGTRWTSMSRWWTLWMWSNFGFENQNFGICFNWVAPKVFQPILPTCGPRWTGRMSTRTRKISTSRCGPHEICQILDFNNKTWWRAVKLWGFHPMTNDLHIGQGEGPLTTCRGLPCTPSPCPPGPPWWLVDTKGGTPLD